MVSKSAQRHLDKWRYKTVNGWINRVKKFKSASLNDEERIAWGKVESWLQSIKVNQYLNDRGVISLSDSTSDHVENASNKPKKAESKMNKLKEI